MSKGSGNERGEAREARHESNGARHGCGERDWRDGCGEARVTGGNFRSTPQRAQIIYT